MVPEVIVVRLIGGLGNQMFQYAAGRALADRLRVPLLLDARDFARYRTHRFGLTALAITAPVGTPADLAPWPVWRREGARIGAKIGARLGLPVRHFIERSLRFDPRIAAVTAPAYLDGYFQSARYFADHRATLADEFTPRAPLSAQNTHLRAMMAEGDSVALHVRRGDYTGAATQKVHGLCSPAYYRAAIARVQAGQGALKFFVFSDDLDWCRTGLDLPPGTVFVDGNGAAPEVDMHLMAACTHHIIANSSFSWWGAWLAGGGVTIAPDPWFSDPALDATDLVPSGWHRIARGQA